RTYRCLLSFPTRRSSDLKAARCGIRVIDLLDKDILRNKLAQNLREKNRLFEKIYGCDPMDVDAILDEYVEYGKQLAPYVCDTYGDRKSTRLNSSHVSISY